MAHDIAHDRQRVLVVLGQVIDHARFLRMQRPAAKVLGADFLACRRLHQWRPGKEDRALLAHDHALVAHGGHIGPACGAAAHHAGDLRDTSRAHLRLVVEDAPEMVAIRKDLRLVGQVRPAAVDKVDARQAVLLRDLLRAQVLLHRHRVVGAALHRRIVGSDHHLPTADTPDSGDHARTVDVPFVHPVGRQLADLEEGRARIEQTLHAITRQQLAARHVPLAVPLGATQRRLGHLLAQLLGQGTVVPRAGLRLGAFEVKRGREDGCGHGCSLVWKPRPNPSTGANKITFAIEQP